MKHLEKCTTILKDSVEDWINFIKDKTNEELVLGLQEKFSNLSTQILEELNLSVLEGEYIEIIKTKAELTSIIESLDNILEFIVSSNFDEIEEINNSMRFIFQFVDDEFVLPLKIAIRAYNRIVSLTSYKLKSGDERLLFDFNTFDIINTSSILDTNKEVKEFVDFNIKLAELDLFLSVNSKTLEGLAFIHSKLNGIPKSRQTVYHKILFDKSKYLIKKVLMRFNSDDKNYYYASIFNENESLNPQNLNIEYYDSFDNKTSLHYYEEAKTDKKKLSFYAQDISRKLENNIDSLTYFEEYHALIKFYKDDNSSLEKLNIVTKDFLRCFKHQLQNEFYIKSFNISLNYLENNKISSKCEKILLITEIEELLSQIGVLQNDNEIRNYFPYFKIATNLIGNLKFIFEDKSKSVDIELAEKILSKLNDSKDKSGIIALLYKNFDWCQERNFSAFQLPFSECSFTKSIESEDFTLFLFSSFILPINYEKVKIEIKDLNREVKKYSTLIDFHKSISKEKIEIKDVKQKIENSEKRSIEIISIFAAIVLFVSGNIQIFTKVDSLSQAFQFMLTFAYSLSLFVLLIWFITRADTFHKSKISIIHKWIIGLLSSVTLFAFLFIFIPPIWDIFNKKGVIDLEVWKKDKACIERTIENTDNLLKHSKLYGLSMKAVIDSLGKPDIQNDTIIEYRVQNENGQTTFLKCIFKKDSTNAEFMFEYK